ncbi:hypothetical protein DL98DRAFT_539824 [Cadophora sp. DSE1049]|nr:hypothetical protein DL98DRAFT_539824 [Cadophora sp. DSE1049]
MTDFTAALKAAELSRQKTSFNIESIRSDVKQQYEIIERYKNDKSTSESSRQLRRDANRQLRSLSADLAKLHNILEEQEYHISFLQDLRERGSFPFQRLPIELRRMVLELLFIRPTWISLRAKPRYTTSREPDKRGTLAFLCTSRQTFEEASSVFYTKNRFRHVSTLGSSSDLLRTVGGSLRNLTLVVTPYMKLAELQLLEKCQKLQQLHLCINEVPPGRIPISIATPNTLTELELSVSKSGGEIQRMRKERLKERLGVILGRGKPGQTLRRSMRLAAIQ